MRALRNILLIVTALLPACATAQLGSPRLGALTLPSAPATPPLDMATTTPDRAVKIAPGGHAYHPILSASDPDSVGLHRLTSNSTWCHRRYDGQAEEDCLFVSNLNDKGYPNAWANNHAYAAGDNIDFGPNTWRVTKAGTSSASGAPSSSAVSNGTLYTNGGVTMVRVNSSVIDANTAIYAEGVDRPGGGKSWVMALNHEMQPGFKPSFNPTLELDDTNNSGTDCTSASGNGCNTYGLTVFSQGANKNTAGYNLYVLGAGTDFGLRMASQDPTGGTAGRLNTGISIDTYGDRAIGIGGLGGAHYGVAVIDIASGTTSPASINLGGTDTLAGINFNGKHNVGIDFRGGTYGSDGNGYALLTTGASLKNNGALTVTSLYCSGSTGSCPSGSGGSSAYPTSPTFTSATFSGSPTNTIDLSGATPGTNQVKGKGWTVDASGNINTTVNIGVSGFAVLSRFSTNLFKDPGAGGGYVDKTMQAASFLDIDMATPSSSTATCTKGQIDFDASYIYVCTATNVRKRAALSAF